jgi:phage-related protein (TIGR01555 family)
MAIELKMFDSGFDDTEEKINYIDALAKKNNKGFIPPKKTDGLTDDDYGLYQTYYSNMRTLGLTNLSLFPGYNFLTLLQQNTMINKGCGTLASELTRKWGRVKSKNADSAINERAENVLKRLKAKNTIYEAALKSFLFGGCLIYIDVRSKDIPNRGPSDRELLTPLFSDASENYEKLKLKNKFIHHLKVIEPWNVTAVDYTTTDPTDPDYYNPRTWLIQGKRIHRDRLLYLCDNPVAQILLPMYRFFGIGTAQMAWDYVKAFEQNRLASGQILKKFSLLVLMTDMEKLFSQNGRVGINKRVKSLADDRDNNSIALGDKLSEEFVQINTPLSGIKEIWYASLELICVAFSAKASRFLGQTPGGLNATGEYDNIDFHEIIQSKQENMLTAQMDKFIRVIKNCEELGDSDLSWEWNSLESMTEQKAVELSAKKAERDAALIGAGVLTPEQAASRLASEDGGEYAGIDFLNESAPDDFGIGDEDFDESKHPRGDDGKFGNTNGRILELKPLELKENISGVKQGEEYYRSNLQGGNVIDADGDKVDFTRAGLKETIHTSKANPDVIKAIPAIKDVIKTGQKQKPRKPTHEHSDKEIIGFTAYDRDVIVDGKNRKVRTIVKNRKNGNNYHTLYIDLDDKEKKDLGVLGKMTDSSQASVKSSGAIVDDFEPVVNLFFVGADE